MRSNPIYSVNGDSYWLETYPCQILSLTGGGYEARYRGGRVGPVQAVLSRRLTEADPGRVVRHKERLAYVIVATPGLTFRLKDLCCDADGVTLTAMGCIHHPFCLLISPSTSTLLSNAASD
jgi:hypothetical protein